MATNTTEIVSTGAIRYNTDSNKMECFDGTKWWQVAVSSPDLGGNGNTSTAPTGNSASQVSGSRVVTGAGYAPGGDTDKIEYFNITTTGDAVTFGDCTVNRKWPGGFSNGTRGIITGGKDNPKSDTADYVTIASTGDAVQWHSSFEWGWSGASHSSSTRGILMGGKNNSNNDFDTINYCTIATTGNAQDFGNLTEATGYTAGTGSPTRAFRFGGGNPTTWNTIDYVTIASTGHAQDFGDLMTPIYRNAALSSTTRALISSGESPASDGLKTIESITMTTIGNAVNFGDRITGGQHPAGGSNCVRGVWAGLQNDGSPWSPLNHIDYVSISTEGNAVDFGDLVTPNMGMAMLSTNHGGL